jgi:hypothetical protein
VLRARVQDIRATWHTRMLVRNDWLCEQFEAPVKKKDGYLRRERRPKKKSLD